MKPSIAIPANPSGQQIKTAIDDAFGKMGAAVVSTRFIRDLVAGENKVAHGFGSVPTWRLYNPEGPYSVHQYRASDREFLYLYVTGGNLRTGIEVS
jgi:hypothetical protein